MGGKHSIQLGINLWWRLVSRKYTAPSGHNYSDPRNRTFWYPCCVSNAQYSGPLSALTPGRGPHLTLCHLTLVFAYKDGHPPLCSIFPFLRFFGSFSPLRHWLVSPAFLFLRLAPMMLIYSQPPDFVHFTIAIPSFDFNISITTSAPDILLQSFLSF
jgi:hypothetical protein